MQCPFCQKELGNAQNACPVCKRPHAPYAAYHLAQGWNELQRGAQDKARAAFSEALRVTPQNDKPRLQAYIDYLVQQSTQYRPSPAQVAPQVAPQAAVKAAPQRGAPGAPPAVAQAAMTAGIMAAAASHSAQQASVAAPALRPRPTGNPSPTSQRALFLNFNDKPMSIVQVMDDAKQKQAQVSKQRPQRLWLIVLLFPAGLPFILADLALGYNICTFSLVALVLWAGAVVGLIVLLRDRPTGNEFGPRFDAARTVFETIKDDLSPKRTLMGWLDLTGPQQPGKVAREAKSPSGMPLKYYRDEWLKMKLSLYDGNVLRVSALERVKAQMGRWKRGSSGKRKWKAGVSQARHELRVALTVNPSAYDVRPQPVTQVGRFLVEVQHEPGRVRLTALADSAPTAGDLLPILRAAYAQLESRRST